MFRWIIDTLLSGWHRLGEQRRRTYLKRLVDRGLHIGRDVVVMNNVRFDVTYPWLIELHDGCRISAFTRILAHDATGFRDVGVTRIGRVRILEGSFIGESVIILPGVTIGPHALVAAGSVVTRDIGEGMVAGGNPARPYGRMSELLERTVESAKAGLILPVGAIDSAAQIAEIRAALDRGDAVFVRDSEGDMTFHHNLTLEEHDEASRAAYERHFKSSGPAAPGAPPREG